MSFKLKQAPPWRLKFTLLKGRWGTRGMLCFINKSSNYKGKSVEPVSLLIGTPLALFRKGRAKGVI
jgi:hypothetical protein